MVTDEQIRRLFMLVPKEATKALAAAKAGMSPKTALKYRKSGQLPSQMKQPHDWRTRADPFADKWPWITELLTTNAGLEAKTLFDYLQRENPGFYQDGQLRTLQRRIKHWRATEGPPREVFFPQVHYPGILSASDFTHMNSLGVTIGYEPFNHMVYHFVLTYSNWEHVSVCYSESFESLSSGMQDAFWELGGVSARHRTDRMSLAVHKDANPEKYTAKYMGLMRHYGLEPERTNVNSGNENGDVEQRHHRFKKAVDQELMLRGSRDFENREAYEKFLKDLVRRLNAGRQERLNEELKVLHTLPQRRLDNCAELECTVSASSTISIHNNVYSVHSRLIGERVKIRMFVDHLEVIYAQKMVERIPRLRGQDGHQINYRHIIDWLARKPGAFANYRYRADMFPGSYFKMAYDELKRQNALQADKQYIQILKIAAHEGEEVTQSALRWLLSRHEEPLTAAIVEQYVLARREKPPIVDVQVADADLNAYDTLLTAELEGNHA
jgi:hypothetical protein